MLCVCYSVHPNVPNEIHRPGELLLARMADAPDPTLPLPISVGSANKPSDKDEDTHATHTRGAVSAFGVWDGHGGKGCSAACADAESGMLSKLTENGRLPTESEVADVFWQLDATVGAKLAKIGGHGRAGGGAHAGATAALLLSEMQADGSLKCMLAWVGDSTMCAVDMKSGRFMWSTSNHAASDEGEAANLRLMAKISKALSPLRKEKQRAAEEAMSPEEREAVQQAKEAAKAQRKADKAARKAAKEAAKAEAAEASESAEADQPELKKWGRKSMGPSLRNVHQRPETPFDDDAEDDDADAAEPVFVLSEEEVKGALDAASISLPPSLPMQVLMRALAREALITTNIPSGAKYRRNAYVQQRVAKKDSNRPWVVATAEDPFSKHYRDLQMTRSVCDWTKSSWVLPEPAFKHFDVPLGKHVRLILASDGLWDVVEIDGQLATDVHKLDTAQGVADAMVERARKVYQDVRKEEKMGDDTTAMVVDLNPSRLAKAAAKSACCAVQ